MRRWCAHRPVAGIEWQGGSMSIQPTTHIVDTCRKERQRSYLQEHPHASPACVELFRRAFAGDQMAWDALQVTFAPLMQRWAGVQQQIDLDDVLQEAFLAFYRSAPKATGLLASDDLAPVLTYLQRCVKTALLSLLRRAHYQPLTLSLDLVHEFIAAEDAIHQSDIRLTLQKRLTELLASEQERLVFSLRFIGNIGPQQIYDEHKDAFADYAEVATIIQRLTRRLRKDEVLQSLHHPRQKPVTFALLTIGLTNAGMGSETPKDRDDMSESCGYQEEVLLDYLTGLASAELCAAIEQSAACRQAAQALAAEIGSWLPYVQRLACPDEDTLVAYQQQEITGTVRLVLHKHIARCPFCQAEIALLAAIDAVPSAPQPTPLRSVIEAFLLAPLAMPAPVRGPLLIYQTPQVHIHLSTRQSAGKARTWTVRGQLRTPARQLITAVEAVWLQNLDDPGVLEELTTLDSNGFFVFKGVVAGNYRLRILTADEEIVIRKLAVGVDE